MKISLIDNYDSFTHLLLRLTEEALGVSPHLMKNDQIDYDIIAKSDLLILSPGPALPKDSGQLMEVIDRFHSSKPILGVCLGHQALAQYFGASLKNLNTVTHGIKSRVRILDKSGIFKNMPDFIEVGRYHSWVVDEKTLPPCLEVIATDEEHGLIMGIKHKELPIQGIQFHPESFMTELGLEMFRSILVVRE